MLYDYVILLLLILFLRREYIMSFCPSCGANNADDSAFCISCGARLQNNAPQSQPMYTQPVQPVSPQPIYTQQAYTQPVQSQPVYAQPTSSAPNQAAGIPSRSCLPLGILSVVFGGVLLGFIFGPIAIVKGSRVIKKHGRQSFAVAAIVLGSIGLFISFANAFACIIMALDSVF